MKHHGSLRVAAVTVGVIACMWVAGLAARAGLARLLADYAVESGRLDAAEAAVRLSPEDAEAHYARAVVFAGAGNASDAAAEYGRAAALRPHDYALWAGLGSARDQAGDAEGALAAFAASAREAPFYGQPRWQLGNALLRAGRRAEALAELRRAAAADPRLFANFVEIAWHASGGEAPSFVPLAAPTTAGECLLVARFLIAHGEAGAALPLARAAGDLPEADRRSLLSGLIGAGAFAEAHELWAGWAGIAGGAQEGALVDGGFERVSGFDDPGFGWRLARGGDAFNVSLDAWEPREGARSLLIDFRGGPPPPAEIASQLVLVEPGALYRLAFAARTRDLVTGGLPLVRVVEAKTGATLAESETLPPGTSGWREFGAEFAVLAGSRAVRVLLVRRPCAQATCPAFGQLWLDDFRLNRLAAAAHG